MAKLCYKLNGTVKKYDLKDSVSGTPKLGVKVGGTTKYLGLSQGTKSGEITVKVSGQTYYVQVNGYDNYVTRSLYYYWSYDDEAMDLYVWPIYNENKVIVAMIMHSCRHTHERDGTGACLIDTTLWPSSADCLRINGDSSRTTTILERCGFNFSPGVYSKVLCKIWADRDNWIGGGASTPSNIRALKNRLLYGNDDGTSRTDTQFTIRDLSVTPADWASSNTYSEQIRPILDTGISLDYSKNWFYCTYPSYGSNKSFLTFLNRNSDSDATKKYLRIYTYQSVYESTRDSSFAAYFEFPENGLMNVSPEEFINEWATASGLNNSL